MWCSPPQPRRVRPVSFRFLSAALLTGLLAAPTLAQPAADPPRESPAERASTLIVFGDDPCPRSSGQEIVVCARLPESERYRVPKRFRGKRADAPAPDSWTSRVSELETVSRAGLPNSCSVVGSGGQTGCYAQFLRQAREERRQAEAETAEIP
ncbi:MAG: hypothetical protein JWM75_131 [Sphingomonas bacterium]|jgi:hypothetical protein|nr:hypothetical protein [Sphingomonas bacterium]